MDSPPLFCSDVEAWAQGRRTNVKITVLKSFHKVHEVRLVAECGSRVAWKMLLQYVYGQFMSSFQFRTDRASVSDSIETLFVEWLRRNISDVVPPTN